MKVIEYAITCYESHSENTFHDEFIFILSSHTRKILHFVYDN